MLTFLDDVEEGGETVFTNVPMPGANPDFSPCARDHLAVKPKKGEELSSTQCKTVMDPIGSFRQLEFMAGM